MIRMKSAAQALFVGSLVAILMLSVLACPVWMGSHDKCNMPSPEQSSSGPCQLTICQLSSPYLASHADENAPVLSDISAEQIVLPGLWTSVEDTQLAGWEDVPPPGAGGPLFLRTHSLLI